MQTKIKVVIFSISLVMLLLVGYVIQLHASANPLIKVTNDQEKFEQEYQTLDTSSTASETVGDFQAIFVPDTEFAIQKDDYYYYNQGYYTIYIPTKIVAYCINPTVQSTTVTNTKNLNDYQKTDFSKLTIDQQNEILQTIYAADAFYNKTNNEQYLVAGQLKVWNVLGYDVVEMSDNIATKYDEIEEYVQSEDQIIDAQDIETNSFGVALDAATTETDISADEYDYYDTSGQDLVSGPDGSAVDNAPEITLDSNDTVEIGTTIDKDYLIENEHLSVIDDIDEDITDTDQVVVDTNDYDANIMGTYSVDVIATDSSNQKTTATEEFEVYSNDAPEITVDDAINVAVATEVDKQYLIDNANLKVTDDNDGDITTSSAVVVDTTYDNDNNATESLITATDSDGLESQATVTITPDYPPVISSDDSVQVALDQEVDKDYLIEHANLNVTDDIDGDITDNEEQVVVEQTTNDDGIDIALVTATDSASNVTTKEIEIEEDTTAPEITVDEEIAIPLAVEIDKEYLINNANLSVVDNVDGDITKTDQVTINTKDYDNTTIGNYEIEIDAIDSSNNASQETTVVNVQDYTDTTAPYIIGKTDSLIQSGESFMYEDPATLKIRAYDVNGLDQNNLEDVTDTIEVVENIDDFKGDGTDAQGDYVITYQAHDKAENYSDLFSYTITVIDQPTLSIDTNADPSIYQHSYTVNYQDPIGDYNVDDATVTAFVDEEEVVDENLDYYHPSAIGSNPKGSEITTCQQMVDDISEDMTADYYLANDIDCSDVDMTPIAYSEGGSNPFSGTFDGNNHVISNISSQHVQSDNEEYSLGGLFGYTENATIKNVGLTDVSVQSTLNNMASDGDTVAVGGLIGETAGNTTIQNVFVIGEVEENTSSVNSMVVNESAYGGLVGLDQRVSDKLTISNSYTNVNVVGVSSVGGIIGYSHADPNDDGIVVLNNVYTDGQLEILLCEDSIGEEQYIGGIAGQAEIEANSVLSLNDLILNDDNASPETDLYVGNILAKSNDEDAEESVDNIFDKTYYQEDQSITYSSGVAYDDALLNDQDYNIEKATSENLANESWYRTQLGFNNRDWEYINLSEDNGPVLSSMFVTQSETNSIVNLNQTYPSMDYYIVVNMTVSNNQGEIDLEASSKK